MPNGAQWLPTLDVFQTFASTDPTCSNSANLFVPWKIRWKPKPVQSGRPSRINFSTYRVHESGHTSTLRFTTLELRASRLATNSDSPAPISGRRDCRTIIGGKTQR